MTEELATIDVKQELSADTQSVFCSVQGGTRADRAKVYNAMNNPSHRVGDFINQKILVKDVLCEVIELADEDTGELKQCPRVVLIDENGESYQAVSTGIFNAVKKAIAVFGAPTWDEPLPVVIKQVTFGKNQMLTFDVCE